MSQAGACSDGLPSQERVQFVASRRKEDHAGEFLFESRDWQKGSSMAVTRILLDTCVIGNHLDAMDPRLDLSTVRTRLWKYRISLADTTMELMEGLIDGTLTDRWNKRIGEVDSVLDRRWPIFPGGRVLSVMASLQTDLTYDMNDSQAYQQALWKLMRDSKSPNDLSKGVRYQISSGEWREIKADPTVIEKGLKESRGSWIEYVERIRTESQAGRIKANSEKELKKLMDKDFGSRPTDPPDMAQKLDGVTSLIAQFIDLSLKSRDPYNPTSNKRRGDVFDLSILYALPLPAVIVTGDQRFLNRLRKTQSPGAGQVISIDEFNTQARQDTLESLVERVRPAAGQERRWNEAAYYRWQSRGSPRGDDWTDWFSTEPVA